MTTRILFIALPKKMPPVSLLALASYVNKKTNHRAGLLGLNGVKDITAAILDRLKSDPPQLVGFSCFTCDYPQVMKLAKIVKQAGCRVVVGNVHASLYPEDFIFEGSPVDFAVIGEGEATLAELLDRCGAGQHPAGLAGLAALGADRKMIVGKKRPLIADLAVLPRPDYGLIEMEPYFVPADRLVPGFPSRAAAVYSSRGCPSACEFCAANTVWKCNTGPSVRFRPIESVIAELVELRDRYGIQCFFFGDDSFLIKRDRVFAFCAELGKLGVFWAVQGRVTQIDAEMAAVMRKAGCVLICFGVESGSEAVLKRVNKEITLAQVKNAFAVCRQYGCARLADIMCNHPGETEKDIELTAELLRQIKPDELSQSVMTPYPGTAIYAKYVNKKPDNYRLFSNIGPEIAAHYKLCEHDVPLSKVLDAYWLAVYGRRLPGSFTALFRVSGYARKVLFTRHFAAISSVIAVDVATWLRYVTVASLPWALRSLLRVWKHRIEDIFKGAI